MKRNSAQKNVASLNMKINISKSQKQNMKNSEKLKEISESMIKEIGSSGELNENLKYSTISRHRNYYRDVFDLDSSS